MKEVVLKSKLGKRGCHSKLSIPDQILLTLQYWREYRTFFHIASDWGINETTALRMIRKVEDILIRSGLFNLPGKKAVQERNPEIKIVVVDVAEHEIERPKKNRKNTIVASTDLLSPQ